MTFSFASTRAMGTKATVTVHGGGLIAEPFLDEIERLEQCWSRFRTDSELSRMNERNGDVLVVSPTLFDLLRHLVAGYQLTGGRFDPTMADQIVALGYDRPYRELADDRRVAGHTRPPEARCRNIELIPSTHTVLLPSGVRIDPGGLGKGLAADIVAASAITAGADGVLVDLGGDIVCRGVAPDGGPWRIAVSATADHAARVIELHDGAVATSDTTVRSWNRGGARLRHVLDPSTGRPVERDLRSTVVAGAGWLAEAIATAAIISTAHQDDWLRQLRDDGDTAIVYMSDLELADA